MDLIVYRTVTLPSRLRMFADYMDIYIYLYISGNIGAGAFASRVGDIPGRGPFLTLAAFL